MKKLAIIIILASIVMSSCSFGTFNVYNDDSKFLLKYGFSPERNSTYFNITIPPDWHITPGELPVGLYWSEVNFLSKDIGYNIEKYKGKNVEAIMYKLNENLSGKGANSKYTYPLNAIILRSGKDVIGAWLESTSNHTFLSLKKNTIEDLTEKPWVEWVKSRGFLEQYKSSLDSLTPEELIYAYFNAINKGDEKTCYEALSLKYLLDKMNNEKTDAALYNTNDPMGIETIAKSAIITKIVENKNWDSKSNGITDSKQYIVNVNIVYKDNVGLKSGPKTFYMVLAKYTSDSPWKIENIKEGS